MREHVSRKETDFPAAEFEPSIIHALDKEQAIHDLQAAIATLDDTQRLQFLEAIQVCERVLNLGTERLNGKELAGSLKEVGLGAAIAIAVCSIVLPPALPYLLAAGVPAGATANLVSTRLRKRRAIERLQTLRAAASASKPPRLVSQ